MRRDVAELQTEKSVTTVPTTSRQHDTSPPSELLVESLVRKCRNITEVMAVEPIQSNFKLLGVEGTPINHVLCLLCHDPTSNSGIECPVECVEKRNGADCLTRKFLRFRRSILDHLKTKQHIKMLKESSEVQLWEKKQASANHIAAISVGLQVYLGVNLISSYRSFEKSIVVASLMPGTSVGDKNHSRAFPPQFIRTMNDVLRQSLQDYISGQRDHLGFKLPFSITADKDTSKHRSRQVSCLLYDT